MTNWSLRFNGKCANRMWSNNRMSASMPMCRWNCGLSWEKFDNRTDSFARRHNRTVRVYWFVSLSELMKKFLIFLFSRLEQNFITEIPPKSFSNFKRLRRIDLSNNNISRVAHDAFNGLKSLTTLWVNYSFLKLKGFSFSSIEKTQIYQRNN